jgi:hypothetical protein
MSTTSSVLIEMARDGDLDGIRSLFTYDVSPSTMEKMFKWARRARDNEEDEEKKAVKTEFLCNLSMHILHPLSPTRDDQHNLAVQCATHERYETLICMFEYGLWTTSEALALYKAVTTSKVRSLIYKHAARFWTAEMRMAFSRKAGF